MKKLLKKVLVLPLCALIATPFSSVLAISGGAPITRIRKRLYMHAVYSMNSFDDLFVNGRILVTNDLLIRQRAESIFRDNPELRDTFEAKISEYRRLLGGANLSFPFLDKTLLRSFFGFFCLENFSSSVESNENFMEQITRKIDNNAMIKSILRRIERDETELVSFVRTALEEFKNNELLCKCLFSRFLRIALV